MRTKSEITNKIDELMIMAAKAISAGEYDESSRIFCQIDALRWVLGAIGKGAISAPYEVTSTKTFKD